LGFAPELEAGYLYCATPFILAGSIHEKRSQLVSRFCLPPTMASEDRIRRSFGREEKFSPASCIFLQFPARFSFGKK
jgi:hypothetical protein